MSRYNIVSTIFLVTLIGSLAVDGMFSISWIWYLAITSVYLVFTIYGSAVLSFQYFVKAHTAGRRDTKSIALTFDDGPIPGRTEALLDALRKHQIPAAFFCIGSRAAGAPHILKRIHNEGHLLGNHSYYHGKFFDLLPGSWVYRELAGTDAVIKEFTGLTPRFFRPPYGVTNPMVAKAVKRGNYTVVGWSVRSFDTVVKDRKKLLARVTRSLKGGDVVLFHDHSEAMLDVLPDFVEHVHNLGLKIVRVDELIKEKPYA